MSLRVLEQLPEFNERGAELGQGEAPSGPRGERRQVVVALAPQAGAHELRTPLVQPARHAVPREDADDLREAGDVAADERTALERLEDRHRAEDTEPDDLPHHGCMRVASWIPLLALLVLASCGREAVLAPVQPPVPAEPSDPAHRCDRRGGVLHGVGLLPRVP